MDIRRSGPRPGRAHGLAWRGKRRARAGAFVALPLLVLLVLLVLPVLLAGCGVREATLPKADAPTLERGRLLLAQYQCGSCHAIPGVAAARGTVAAPLAAFGLRSYIAGRVPNGPEALARWIVEPAALVPGTAMPSMGVSEQQARDMAAYLHSLR